jgi:hypothetical protein
VTGSQVTRSRQYSGADIACMNAAGSVLAAFDRAIHEHAGHVKRSCPELPHDPGDLRRGQHHLDRPGLMLVGLTPGNPLRRSERAWATPMGRHAVTLTCGYA